MNVRQDEWWRREIAKHKNKPRPDKCPKCGSELEVGKGYVGEEVLYCGNEACLQSICWEDNEDALRRVI